MAKQKFDAVVEAVHYKPDGEVDWLRAYLRRGPTFSDVVLVDRQSVIEHLKSGKKFMVGKRVRQMASTFDVSAPIKVFESNGKDVLVTGDIQSDKDKLPEVPVI
jgi:hypothetical protein